MKNIYQTLVLLVLLQSYSLQAQQWEVEKRVDPRYPIKALQSDLSGCVKMQFFINTEGVPVYIEPIKSSNPELFDSAAVEALSKWRYKATENNDDKVPERQVVELSFSTLSNPHIESTCNVEMTFESNNMEIFRQARLSMPIEAHNFNSWKASFAKIVRVLSDDELRHLFKSYSSLWNNQEGSRKDKLNAFLILVNGLNYFQLIDLANVKPDENSYSADNVKGEEASIDINKIPFITMKELYQQWETSDMAISMASTLYKEISYQLLKVEVVLNRDGTAKLLSTCRKVSDEMKTALEDSIDDWQVRKKVTTAETVRFVYRIPAPSEAGAYIHCDDSWRS